MIIFTTSIGKVYSVLQYEKSCVPKTLFCFGQCWYYATFAVIIILFFSILRIRNAEKAAFTKTMN